jgi:mRNA interferase MazF
MPHPYCPKRGDIVWLSLAPQAGHEQAGRRPALALSPEAYHRKAGLALFCPITTRIKGYPFEVPIPSGLKASGVILADQVKSLDWHVRDAEFSCKVPETTLMEVLEKLGVLLSTRPL